MRLFTGLMLIVVLLAGCNLNAAPTATQTFATEAPTIPPTLESTLVTTTPQPTTITPNGSLTPTGELTPTISASAAVPVSTIEAGVPFPTLYINSYSISAREGQTIYVNYEVTLDNPGQGQVFLLVLDPTGVEAGRLALSETKTDVLEVEAELTGAYILYVTPDNVRGNYATSFGTR